MKTKYILISFLTLVLLGIAGSSYAGYDASHNDSNSIACSDCHFASYTPGDDICVLCHTNDTGGGYSKMSAPKVLSHTSSTTSTKYGTWSTMCKDCHYPHDQPRVLYGSQTYLVTGNIASVTNNGNGTTTYGYNNFIVYKPEWANPAFWGDKSGSERGLILVIDPDNPYTGRGGEIRDATATTITLTGAPRTLTDPTLVGRKFALVYGQYIGSSNTKTIRTPSGQIKPAKFFNNTGPNSFAYSETGAPTDPVVDGVCQVCHTMTGAWRADGSLAAVGVHAGLNGADCMQCHKHEAGFKASGCDTCHGNPPINNTFGGPDGLVLLSNGAKTGSLTAGAHNRHVNGVAIGCDSCHFNSVGAGATHNDGTLQAVTLGFYLFNGTVQGGSYNGQSGVDYNTTTTNPGTTVTITGLKQCGNIYCHSSGQSSTGGATPTYATPIWDSTGMTCGSCHQNMDTSATATGSHIKHAQGSVNIACATCHSGYTETTATPATHVNNLINLGFTGTGAGTSYSQGLSSPVGNNYGSCSTSYCHSSGQSSTGGATPTYAPQTWGGGALNCGSCHQDMDTSATATGSHLQHAQGTINYSCATCHAGNTETTYNTATHVDQQINLGFSVTNTYSQGLTSPAGNNYGSCSTSDCHGSNSGIWGTNTTNQTCTKCHGNPTAPATYTLYKAAPGADTTGVDTNGNSAATDPQVGAHDTHLRSLNNYSSDIACNQCHTVPASATDAGHLGPLPADLTWGTLATLNGATPLYASGTCSTTYCHGAKMPRGTTAGTDTSPAWTDVNYLTGVASNDCGKCHGYPPVAISAHLSNGLPVPPTTCINCHDHVNAAGTGFTDINKHVNGILEATGGDNCTDCHTNTSLSAGHLNHTNPNTVLSGKKLSAGDYGNPAWWYSYSNTGGVPLAACGYCHPNTQSTHMNNVKNLNLDPNEVGLPAGTLKGKNGSPPVFTQNPGVSVTCSSVYCHSDGYSPSGGGPTARDYGYKTTPNWYGGTFTGDTCAACHGNSPTGSSAHGKHAVGIHYKTIYNLETGGLATAGNTPTGSHGNAATSTSINCNLCHNSTVTVSYNAQNAVCLNCHTDTNTPATGNESISINGTSTVHVNGVPDVNFAAVQIRSKAQVRDDITAAAVPELAENWTRVNGYKGAVSGSHDMSVSALNTSSYTGGNCTVSCHNGFPVQWTSTVTCTSCHTALPQ